MSEPATVPPLVPSYATAATGGSGPSVGLYRAAIACGALPLLVGVTVLLLYWLMRAKALAFCGLLTILGGLVLVGVALLLLMIAARQAWRDGRPTFGVWRKRIRLAAVLLAANFPAAFVCAAIGERLMNTSYLTIHNAGTTRVDSFVVMWPGGSEDLGPIEVGAAARGSFVVKRDGAVTFQERRGATASEGTLEGYTTGGQRHDLAVVTQDATVTVNGSPTQPLEPDN